MEIKNFILPLFLIGFLCGCFRGEKYTFNFDVVQDTLSIRLIEENRICFEIPNKMSAELVCDPVNETTSLIVGGDAIPLEFYIIQPYLNEIYCYNHNAKSYLIIESNVPGASGIAANILEVCLVVLENDMVLNNLSYSSFHAGATLLDFDDNLISLTIFNISSKAEGTDEDIFCSANFSLINGRFEVDHDKEQSCYIWNDKGMFKVKESCGCKSISEPYVMK